MASPKDFISPVNSEQELVYPFRNYLNYLHAKYSDLQTGHIADYIPELALQSIMMNPGNRKRVSSINPFSAGFFAGSIPLSS